MFTQLLTTKLYIPPVRSELVPRPRLIERLNAGLHRKLTLISAPAGFGKTTLLSEWIAGCGRPVAWVSLDESDNDPARFLAYFVAALQTLALSADGTSVIEGIEARQETVANIGEAALAMLQSPQPPPIESILTTLINEIAIITNEFVLVLDDYHLIDAYPIHDALTFLLGHLPPQMHLSIAGRADPPLPLARLRGRGQLTELRAADLRFTPDEAAAFLNDVMGLGLSTEDIATLDARTEGWIAGLQMAALSMQARKDVSGFIKAFSGSHRFVLDYLVEEVLDRQSSDVQEFLLKTSILERMTAPLCDAVTGRAGSQIILTRLEQANLFLIPLDDERRWYRYHHLFADLLRSRLEQPLPSVSPASGEDEGGGVPALHRRASEWYEKKGLISEAVGYALAANDIERVVRLVAGNALAMIYHSELRTLVRWLDALPDEAVRSQPWLCVAHAWTLAQAGKFDAVEPLLQEVEKALVGPDEHIEGPVLSDASLWTGLKAVTQSEAEGQRIVGHIAAIRAYAAALRGEISRAVELAREALEHLPAGDLMVRGYTTTLLSAVLRLSGDLVAAAEASAEALVIGQAAGDSHLVADVLCDLAALHFLQGQLHKAVTTCRDAQQIADKYVRQGGRPLPVMGYAYIRLSVVLREWNDLETATRCAREGLELCRQWGQADVLVYGYSEVAKVSQAIGDADDALDAIQNGERIAISVSPWLGIHVAAQQARLWLVQGNLEAASRWVQESGLSIDDRFGFQHLFRYIILARVLIAQGAFDKAVGLLARLLEVTEAAGAIGYVIEILVLQTLALQALGKVDQALTALERALSLAEPEGYVRTFIDEGALIGELLRQAAVRGIAPDYVSKLLSALGATPPRSHTPTLIEPLSERELEVLRLLTTHLPHAEIAEKLFISINTVRSHVKNIFSKLNVHNRIEAVQRAEELGLI